MLVGEVKRREVAIKWIREVEEILLTDAKEIWGGGDYFGPFPSYTVTLTVTDIDNRESDTCLYFRYRDCCGKQSSQVGFYNNLYAEGNMRGKPIESLKGTEFWYAIKVIIEWIPQVITMVDEKEDYRNALLGKLK